MCQWCRFDALYYGRPLRLFLDAATCLGCYLNLHDSAFDASDRADHEATFIALPNADLRQPIAA